MTNMSETPSVTIQESSNPLRYTSSGDTEQITYITVQPPLTLHEEGKKAVAEAALVGREISEDKNDVHIDRFSLQGYVHISMISEAPGLSTLYGVFSYVPRNLIRNGQAPEEIHHQRFVQAGQQLLELALRTHNLPYDPTKHKVQFLQETPPEN